MKFAMIQPEINTKEKISIDRKLIQEMHDAYLKERESAGEYMRGYYEMVNNGRPEMMGNARLYQGRHSALTKVVNDFRYILGLPEIGVDSNAYGYIFNFE